MDALLFSTRGRCGLRATSSNLRGLDMPEASLNDTYLAQPDKSMKDLFLHEKAGFVRSASVICAYVLTTTLSYSCFLCSSVF